MFGVINGAEEQTCLELVLGFFWFLVTEDAKKVFSNGLQLQALPSAM